MRRDCPRSSSAICGARYAPSPCQHGSLQDQRSCGLVDVAVVMDALRIQGKANLYQDVADGELTWVVSSEFVDPAAPGPGRPAGAAGPRAASRTRPLPRPPPGACAGRVRATAATPARRRPGNARRAASHDAGNVRDSAHPATMPRWSREGAGMAFVLPGRQSGCRRSLLTSPGSAAAVNRVVVIRCSADSHDLTIRLAEICALRARQERTSSQFRAG